jgi:hypothetical protein
VTDASHRAVVALLDPSLDPASVIADLVRLQGLFDQEMRGLTPSLDPRNLGDVAARHERSSVPDAGVKAIRRAARTDLALNRRGSEQLRRAARVGGDGVRRRPRARHRHPQGASSAADLHRPLMRAVGSSRRCAC